jgi:multiple sugar transport system substrate-binding protein
MRDATAADKVHIDVGDPTCTRVNDMVQSLIDNGTAPTVSIFDPPFAKLGTENKILMLPGASWMGDFVFKPTYKTPAGQLAAAPIPKWEGEDAGYSGTVGGGIWAVSKHAKNAKGAADMITWMTTDLSIQNEQPTYPANKTAAASWSKNKKADAFYATNPIPVFEQQAGLIRQNWKFVRYATVATNEWNELVVAGLKDGKKLSELVPAYGEELKKAAGKAGYTVE